MRRTMRGQSLVLGTLLLGVGASYVAAQRTGAEPDAARKSPAADALVERMMSFDTNGDGKLAREEVTDDRLQRLFQRADSDGDGTVPKAELAALAAREAANDRDGAPGSGPRGFGPPPGGPMPGAGVGQVLPVPLQERLGLTSDQRARVEALQKEVDEKLGAILNEQQKAELAQLRSRGPRPFGPPRGGPAGRPPQ